MRHYIESISFQINNEPFNLKLEGKNLIISGNNGSGKTKLIERIFSFVEESIKSHNPYTLEQAENDLKSTENNLQRTQKGHGNYDYFINDIEKIKIRIKAFNEFNITFNDLMSFRASAKEKSSIIRLFPAIREAKIKNDGRISSLDLLLNEYDKAQKNNSKIDAGTYFERYIVTLWNYALVSKGVGKDDDSERVFKIIDSINKDLKALFEDDSIRMDFDLDKLKIFLLQDNKQPFGLDQLSSGFSSILAIYTDLLIKAELDKINKHEMKGIVLIDEIDAHLHVTLQKKVFSFFASSFPNMQFIVSTHSPFVIQSVSDAIVFNLSTLDAMGDLSLYSYSSIIKGMLGEDVSSDKLNSLVRELMILVENNCFNDRFDTIIDDLQKHNDFLDKTSRAAFMLAKSKYLDYSEREQDV
ncbi:TPA: AAA family ATPase [Klebsiella variicola]|uniref:AAA family ATPase n=1 Tax=Klebsiella variicola TaxID=244366 RepID=UPI00103411ED|nr:AAA family ATPase [Klebsiella variicola]HBQ6252844.1 AAA family ATPase [Klebsiella variicola subsp. variicola]MBC5097351.1 AAA family ATPase [Klebsiella variicola]MCI4419669.1 AAA family ATPase [Klebsiella variicola]HBQ6257688.1 AAA family ATPase [Klebsiella variicola subsp. variicola]HBQ6649576.1 AAA family ATPase [Klebsiella variicola subsp. variicola]